MSVKVMSLVWDADLGSPTRKLIALKLADCANDKGESIYPSISTIAADTDLSDRAVRKALADLRHDGLLRVTRQGGPRTGPTRYRMHLPWLHERQRRKGVGHHVPQGGAPRAYDPSVEPSGDLRKRARGKEGTPSV